MIIEKEQDIIRNIVSDDIEVLRTNDDKMRKEWNDIYRIEDRYFIRNAGNVSPYQLRVWYVEISKSQCDELLAIKDIDVYTDYARMTVA